MEWLLVDLSVDPKTAEFHTLIHSPYSKMKIIVFLSLLSACYAQFQFPEPYMPSTRLGEDGTSSITEHYRNDNQGNYDFGYNEGHNEGGTFRREIGDAYGRKYGTYGYTNNEGLIRIVNYVADENGFRAELKSTEPGVDEKEPASVIVFKEDTPTLMTYPGPEAASVPDANGNIPGFTPAASAPIPYALPAPNNQPLVNYGQRIQNVNTQYRN